ncbi:MAG: hypothetical protein V4590_14925 [Bacteroidota bacterium]
MTVEEYVNELQEDLKAKWEIFVVLWNNPAHVDYEKAKFEWQLANNKYREFTNKLINNLHINIDSNVDDMNWN